MDNTNTNHGNVRSLLFKRIIMKKTIIIAGVLLTTSCGMLTEVSKEEKELNYKIDLLYLDYSYKRDSLILEYYKEQNYKQVPCENCDEID